MQMCDRAIYLFIYYITYIEFMYMYGKKSKSGKPQNSPGKTRTAQNL